MQVEQLKKSVGAYAFYAWALVIVLGAVIAGFKIGQLKQEQTATALLVSTQTIENLHQEHETLTKKINTLGVELSLAKQQIEQSRIEAGKKAEQAETLKTELAFYQKVMAPELKEKGFSIDSFEVTSSASENTYRFDVTLMQHEKIKNQLKGNLNIVLRGSENGRPRSYKADKLLQESSNLSYSFKYFQVVSGNLVLPQGFTVEEVQIDTNIYQFKRKRGELSRTFKWQVKK